MESKRVKSLTAQAVRVLLLIEPVWNRNYGQLRSIVNADGLLIEPVWNRNNTRSLNSGSEK